MIEQEPENIVGRAAVLGQRCSIELLGYLMMFKGKNDIPKIENKELNHRGISLQVEMGHKGTGGPLSAASRRCGEIARLYDVSSVYLSCGT